MKVYPVAGRALRDPHTRRLVGPEGLEVGEHDALWAWLVDQGDAGLEPPPAVEEPEAPQGEAGHNDEGNPE
jgi:hypothetical protein